jgi:hypothetical protein
MSTSARTTQARHSIRFPEVNNHDVCQSGTMPPLTCLSTSASTRRNTGSFLRLMYESRRCTSCCRASLTRSFASGRCLWRIRIVVTGIHMFSDTKWRARALRRSGYVLQRHRAGLAGHRPTPPPNSDRRLQHGVAQNIPSTCTRRYDDTQVAHSSCHLMAAYVCSSKSMLDW